jgi:hypothetical protein
MDNDIIRKCAEESGLVDGGKDEEGNQLWIGENEQWNRFEILKEKYEEVQNDEVFNQLNK